MQEIQKYEKLIDRVVSSLQKLQRAVDGQDLMSLTFESMMISMLNNEVPKNWKEVAYPSLKPLSSWIEDLGQRIDFMRKWATSGHPPCFWLAGFIFPHGFFTGVLQTFARKY